MGESLTERRRVEDEGLRVVNSFCERKIGWRLEKKIKGVEKMSVYCPIHGDEIRTTRVPGLQHHHKGECKTCNQEVDDGYKVVWDIVYNGFSGTPEMTRRITAIK